MLVIDFSSLYAGTAIVMSGKVVIGVVFFFCSMPRMMIQKRETYRERKLIIQT